MKRSHVWHFVLILGALFFSVAAEPWSALVALEGKLLENGNAPILLEPVKARVSFTSRSIAAVKLLDHSGRRTGKTLAVSSGSFTLNSANDRSL